MTTKFHKYWNTLNLLVLRSLIWLLVLPAGWWLVATSYRLQKHWTETRFIVCYLLLYVLVAMFLLMLPKAPLSIPGLTAWTLSVFAGVGIGRVLWAMVQHEYDTGVEIPLRSTFLMLTAGTTSLWGISHFQKPRKKKPVSEHGRQVPHVVRMHSGEAVSAIHEEMHLW